MKRYDVSVTGCPFVTVSATSPRIAVNKALRYHEQRGFRNTIRNYSKQNTLRIHVGPGTHPRPSEIAMAEATKDRRYTETKA